MHKGRIHLPFYQEIHRISRSVKPIAGDIARVTLVSERSRGRELTVACDADRLTLQIDELYDPLIS